jgi:hypothetical protein
MKWNFNELRDGDEKQGIRDGDMSDFNKTHYKSVVRESIQNSLDARKDYNEPVKVTFEFSSFQKPFINGFSKIESHIIQCKNYAKNEDDIEFLEEMINSFESDSYSYIKISDFNTIGMETETTYDSFANSRNISSKNSKGSAGSKGMGKAVYFASSYLQTIIVSTKSETEQIFQGITKISTHNYSEKLLSHKGFFGNSISAITTQNDIPNTFKRTEIGTSIYVIGVKQDENRVSEMVKELITNFWLAIYENDLIVEIDNTEYNKDNIYDIIKENYTSLDESGHYNEKPNPRPYIETYLKKKNTHKEYKKNLDIIGESRLFLAKNNNYPGRIAFYRKSKMLIYKDSSKIYKGYCGLFICDDSDGNEILKKLENAKHNEWKKGNWKNPIGAQAIKEIEGFIKESVEDFTDIKQGMDISIPELDKLLGISNVGVKKDGVRKDPSGKETAKPKTKKTEPKDRIPKTFNWLRCKTIPINNKYKYHISIDSKISNKNVDFEILVGSDDKNGKNKVNIDSISNGSFEKNIVKLNLTKGLNEFVIVLKDSIKHTIRMKEFKMKDNED